VRAGQAANVVVVGLTLLALLAPAGCSQTVSSSSRDDAPPWTATFEQDRPDHASRNADVKLTNTGRTEVTVDRVRLRWSGYRPVPWQPADMTYAPGHVHRLDVRLPEPRCVEQPAGIPAAQVRTVVGSTYTVAFDAAGSARLRQLWQQDCREVRLLEAVRMRLEDWRRVRRGGVPALRGDLVAQRGSSSAQVRLVETRGSVLLDLQPLGSRRVLLPRGDRTGRVPVLVTSAGRCDPHSLGQSTQTFTLTMWLSLDGGPEQAWVTIPDVRTRARMQDVITDGCRVG
jgi:hypothetical protein